MTFCVPGLGEDGQAMCGIAGIQLSRNSAPADTRGAAAAMCRHMQARGPDAQHVRSFDDGRVAIGHRRLAILDLDARADQPMFSADGRRAIVLNGEIYNFRALRKELEQDGVRFRTNSDTEVVLQLYAHEGPAMLERLRGMFALAIWDEDDRSLFLARDAYGIKPLYLAKFDGGFAFASQVKALLASGLVPRGQDNAGLAGFYLWGHVPEPFTLYSAIKALPAGHWTQVRGGKQGRLHHWADIREHWQGPSLSLTYEETAELVRREVADTVAAHMVSDVPVSVFLSGGIDSSTVAAHGADLGKSPAAITLGFQEFSGHNHDEVPLAREAAQRFALPHKVRTIGREEFVADLPKILDAMDQPSVDGINSWFASKAAAEAGFKVVLSGVGGDELFCGYRSFRQIPRLAAAGRLFGRLAGVQPVVRPILAALGRHTGRPKLSALIDHWASEDALYRLRRGLFLPHELPDLMGTEQAEEGLERLTHSTEQAGPLTARDGAATIGLLESTHYLRNQLLRDSDWASMAHSLELRTPLVDIQLLSALGPLTSAFTEGRGKRHLARSPLTNLPSSITQRHKTGFAVPMVGWIAEAAGQHIWQQNALVKHPETPWARRWAFALQQQELWRSA